MHFLKVSICWTIVCFNYGILKVFASDKTWNVTLEHIGPDGEIRPIMWNPAFRKWTNEEPLGHLDPKGEIQTPMGRIIGGRDARHGQIPYQVAIFMRRQSGQHELWCGGTIYNRRTILSAGHCFHNQANKRDKSEFVFVVGKSNTKVREGSEMQRLASSIIVHPGYEPGDGIFDVAIIKLRTPVRYTYHVQPLPPGNPVEGEKAIISGWGYTRVRPNQGSYDRAGYGSFLKTTQVKIYTKPECVDLYGKVAPNLAELAGHKNYVCAGVDGGGVDACAGDSGGPLACTNSKGDKSLCGIVSSGIGCGLPGHPGFYMNLTVFIEWIETHAGKPDRPKRT